MQAIKALVYSDAILSFGATYSTHDTQHVTPIGKDLPYRSRGCVLLCFFAVYIFLEGFGFGELPVLLSHGDST